MKKICLIFIFGDERVELELELELSFMCTNDWLRLKYEIHVMRTSAELSSHAVPSRVVSFNVPFHSTSHLFRSFRFRSVPFHFRFSFRQWNRVMEVVFHSSNSLLFILSYVLNFKFAENHQR